MTRRHTRDVVRPPKWRAESPRPARLPANIRDVTPFQRDRPPSYQPGAEGRDGPHVNKLRFVDTRVGASQEAN